VCNCPDTLTFRSLTKDEIRILGDADFGENPFQMEINNWIRDESDVFLKKGRGCIWGLYTSTNRLVGFMAFGPETWNIGVDRKIQVIHYFGIIKEFQGYPRDGDEKCRYSRQAMRRIMEEAKIKKEEMPFVGLLVHPENTGAQKLYKRFGFTRIDGDYIDEETGQNYHRKLAVVI
jgi:ribosomal protein S18 acetylase RimI-like enzyme